MKYFSYIFFILIIFLTHTHAKNNFDSKTITANINNLTPEQKLVKELLEKSQIKSLIQSQVSSNANFIEQIKTKMSHELQRLASFNDPQGLYVDCLCILEP